MKIYAKKKMTHTTHTHHILILKMQFYAYYRWSCHLNCPVERHSQHNTDNSNNEFNGFFSLDKQII